MLVQILVDNPQSWIVPFASQLRLECISSGHESVLLYNHKDVIKGDILCLLGCERKFLNLGLNAHNLVVHESDLPKGKGWSPLTWQILEGRDEIPITLFEASQEIDAGEIYLQDILVFEGHELVDELREMQGKATVRLIMKFISQYPDFTTKKQSGESTYYSRRGVSDSELDINKSILALFNLFRVVDNDKYPAFFKHKGKKYRVRVDKIEDL